MHLVEGFSIRKSDGGYKFGLWNGLVFVLQEFDVADEFYGRML